MATLDPDTWYRIYPNSPGASGFITTLPNYTSILTPNQTTFSLWRFIPENDYYYIQQNITSKDWWQLGTYVDPTGGLTPDTRLTIQSSLNDTSQQWRIESWGNGFSDYKLENVGLGDSPVLDCHNDGIRLFMKSQPDITLLNEHWLFSSITKIESATPTNSIATTTSSGSVITTTISPSTSQISSPSATPNSSSNSNSGLSTGAKVGLGVGITAGVIFLITLLWIFISRKRKSRKRDHESSNMSRSDQKPPIKEIHELSTSRASELESSSRIELPS